MSNSLSELDGYLFRTLYIPYNLRQSSKEYKALGLSKESYGDLTFKSFYARLSNKHNSLLNILRCDRYVILR